MKKVLMFLLFVFSVAPASAQWKETIKSFLPQVSSPAAEQAGIHFQGTPFQIVNSTSFYCRLVIGNKNVGVVGPGDLAFDERRWHNQWYQYIPVAAICYLDAAMTDYIGVGGRPLMFNEYAPAEWTIRLSDIRTPDGRPLPEPTVSATTPTSRKIKLPREWWASSTGIQVVNNTASDIAILINGKPVATIGAGGVDYVRAELIGGYSRPIIITITNGRDCTYTEQVWVYKNYPSVRQIIFGFEYCSSGRWR